MKSVTKLICRDLRRAFGLRTLGIWVVMALFTIYFFFFSNGRRELVENNRLEYMSLFLPLIIFGAWAVMAVFFDLISADRERNVLDCILCSGTTKKHVFIAKIIATAIVSLALSFIYLAPIAIIVTCLSNDWEISLAALGLYHGICSFRADDFRVCPIFQGGYDLEFGKRACAYASFLCPYPGGHWKSAEPFHTNSRKNQHDFAGNYDGSTF